MAFTSSQKCDPISQQWHAPKHCVICGRWPVSLHPWLCPLTRLYIHSISNLLRFCLLASLSEPSVSLRSTDANFVPGLLVSCQHRRQSSVTEGNRGSSPSPSWPPPAHSLCSHNSLSATGCVNSPFQTLWGQGVQGLGSLRFLISSLFLLQTRAWSTSSSQQLVCLFAWHLDIALCPSLLPPLGDIHAVSCRRAPWSLSPPFWFVSFLWHSLYSIGIAYVSANGDKHVSLLWCQPGTHRSRQVSRWRAPDHPHAQRLPPLSRQVWACEQPLTGFVRSVQEEEVAQKRTTVRMQPQPGCDKPGGNWSRPPVALKLSFSQLIGLENVIVSIKPFGNGDENWRRGWSLSINNRAKDEECTGHHLTSRTSGVITPHLCSGSLQWLLTGKG